MVQLKLVVPLAAVVGAMLVGGMVGPALGACDGERGDYGTNHDVVRADALIACLDGEAAKVAVATDPTFGTPLPGNPTFHEIERRLNEFKRQFNIPDAKWSELMNSSAVIDPGLVHVVPAPDLLVDPQKFKVDPAQLDGMMFNNMTVGQ